VLFAVTMALGASARAQGSAASAPAGSAIVTVVGVDAVLVPVLRGASRAERLEAARSASKLGRDAAAAVEAKLADLAKAKTPGVGAALEQARRAMGKDGDLLEVLAGLEETSSKIEPTGARTALATVALARALAAAETTAAARALVRLAGEHQGALRPELARLLRTLGDHAVPALLETRKDAPPAVRAWAFALLEGMGKRIPGDAVQTKDPGVLVDVLGTYARIGDLDALPVILSFVNADRANVRSAARDAVVSYGPEAVWKLREAYANVAGKPAPEGASVTAIAKDLFAAYDRLRLQEVYGLFDDALASSKEGRLEAATAAFDKVLARQPLLDRRSEAVPTYVQHARKIADADPVAARAGFEKALRLAPEGPWGPQIEAELAFLDGEDLLARGVVDEATFRRALAKDPAHAKARAQIERLEESRATREKRVRAFGGAGVVLLLGIASAILFGGYRSRRSARA
jgi:hypothetical protein